MVEQFRELHGLNDPLIVQFGRYVWDVLHLDFGESLRQARPAIDVVLPGLRLDALAGASSPWCWSPVAAIVIGSLAAFRPGGVFDRIVTFTSLIGASAPDFWIAIVGITVFAIGLGWLPTSGTGTVWHWILPIGVLFIRPFGLILQVVRGSMVQAFGSAYVKTARAKGVGDRSIIFVHTLRNAMLPVITVIGDQAAALLNGAVVVETIFGFPGVGKLMIELDPQPRLQRHPRRDHGHRDRDLRHEPADRPRLRGARSAHPDLSPMAATSVPARRSR